jgi:DNA-binding transcriptional ArsR family regulator
VEHRERKVNLRHSEAPYPIRFPSEDHAKRVPRIAFGLVPLTTPYSDSEPEHRILNAVARGLLFERMKEPATEFQMSKMEFSRALRSLKNDGLIYLGQDGKYRLAFGTANFPNLIAREDGI